MTINFDETEFDTISYDNGDYYEGSTLNRIPHGEGTMYYDCGETVTGMWIFGERVKGKRDERIPKENSGRDSVLINNRVIYVGYAYDNETIASIFGVSKFIRGIRIHHDAAVLLSTGESIYKDGSGWEPDSDGDWIFTYTGEGQTGDQEMTYGNLFLKRSAGNKVFLFVKRRPDEYVFHGQVIVKRIETAVEPDKFHHKRKVFKFILSRI